MSDLGRLYTEREVVLRERKAYENGLLRGTACEFNAPPLGDGTGMAGLLAAVAKAFPLPKVIRPRVRSDGAGIAFKLVDGVLHWLTRHDQWVSVMDHAYQSPPLTQSRVEVLADLLANPTEEVEA